MAFLCDIKLEEIVENAEYRNIALTYRVQIPVSIDLVQPTPSTSTDFTDSTDDLEMAFTGETGPDPSIPGLFCGGPSGFQSERLNSDELATQSHKECFAPLNRFVNYGESSHDIEMAFTGETGPYSSIPGLFYGGPSGFESERLNSDELATQSHKESCASINRFNKHGGLFHHLHHDNSKHGIGSALRGETNTQTGTKHTVVDTETQTKVVNFDQCEKEIQTTQTETQTQIRQTEDSVTQTSNHRRSSSGIMTSTRLNGSQARPTAMVRRGRVRASRGGRRPRNTGPRSATARSDSPSDSVMSTDGSALVYSPILFNLAGSSSSVDNNHFSHVETTNSQNIYRSKIMSIQTGNSSSQVNEAISSEAPSGALMSKDGLALVYSPILFNLAGASSSVDNNRFSYIETTNSQNIYRSKIMNIQTGNSSSQVNEDINHNHH